MKRGLVPIASLILVPPLMFMAASCGQGGTPISTQSQQPAQLSPEDQANNGGDYREPGKVIVGLRDGVTEEEAYEIFAAHGFSKKNVNKQEYLPEVYVLTFSEKIREINSVIEELHLDSQIKYADPYWYGKLDGIPAKGVVPQ